LAVAVLTRVAAHPDELVAALAGELAQPLGDPFATEVVAVPTRGIERWLTQRISSELAALGVGDGVCANVRFTSPRRLVEEVLRGVPALAVTAEAWDTAAQRAHLLTVIDDGRHEPWLALVARYVAGPDESVDPVPNRLAAATKMARLFDTYARRRPEMIRAWAGGVDVGPDGAPLPDRARWQPMLWRALRDRIGAPSFPEVLPDARQLLRTDATAFDLPPRLMVYGLTAIDPLDLDVLMAVGANRAVHLFLLNPSPALWAAVATPAPSPGLTRSEAARAVPPGGHTLLRSWGQESRELQLVLAGRGVGGSPEPSPPFSRATLLARIQYDIRRDRPARVDAALSAAVAAGEDRSVQVHICHGPRRQVEVVRDAVLHALSADPTLEPRDVVIMTPDLATFAPLLEGAFPAGEAAADGDGVPDLRLRIADRSPAATNPLVRFAASVLALAGSRFEAASIRDLVSRPVVQQRFGFDADTAGTILTVIDDTNVRWGLDATERVEWGAGHNPERTWRRALDRALAGVFTADSPIRVLGDVAPLDGVEGQEAAPVGILAAVLDRLAAIRDLLGGGLALSEWPAAIGTAVRMLAAPAWGEEWQWAQLERLLRETFPPTAAGDDPPVTLTEARSALAAWSDDRPSPLHFRTGDITVCTLVPMRSVPYRIVCLLGMDDERFPRTSRTDGDDLLVGHEIVGDHDRAAEDRQLLLDALLAASDQLIVTYSGKDELTAVEYPPAVPVAELLDLIATMVAEDAGGRVVTEHPLQPFAVANFAPRALGLPGPWAFDPVQLAAAEAAQRRLPADGQGGTWPEWEVPTEIRLDDLIAYLQHPTRRFLRTRAGFTVPPRSEAPDDSLPVTLGSLEAWAVKDRLLTGLIAGHDIDALVARERSSDALPPGDLAVPAIEAAVAAAEQLAAAAARFEVDPSRRKPWSGAVAVAGYTVVGSVLADPEHAHIAVVTPSKIKAATRLRAIAELAFLTALEPEQPWRAILVGRRDGGEGHIAVTVDRLGRDPDERRTGALTILGGLVALFVEGHQRPLPIPCETAFAWQRRAGSDRSRAAGEAKEKWEGRFSEGADPAHVMVFPHLAATDRLIAEFAGYCERLWGPLLWLMREKNV
jgi:exodeoxyribonuclease V gamma subunit